MIEQNDKTFRLGDTHYHRHTDQSDKETDQTDKVAMLNKKCLYHCGSNCS